MAASAWLPFAITYKVGRRTLTVERFAADATSASESVVRVLADEYFLQPVTIISVEAISGFYPR